MEAELTTFECDLTAKPIEKFPEEKKSSTIFINLRVFRQNVYRKLNGHETIKIHELIFVSKISHHFSLRRLRNRKDIDFFDKLKPKHGNQKKTKFKPIKLNGWVRKRASSLISSKAATCMDDDKTYSVEANVDVIFEKRYIDDEIVSEVEVKEEEEKKKICAICLDELSGGVGCTETQCSHNFHRDCIWNWLRKNMSCPSCRSCVCGKKPCSHGKVESDSD